MKILMDARSLGTRPSGIGIYIYTLVKALTEYPDIEFSLITDICESDEMKELAGQGIPVHKYGKPVGKGFGLFSYYRYVQKCINEEKPDVFWEGNTLIPIRVRNPYGKMFATIHDMFPLSDPEHYGRIYPHYFRFGIHQSIRYFDTFVYNSYDTKNETEKYFPKIRQRNSFVGYIVVPKMEERPVTDNGSFLYIGNMETRKGTDILLKAYALYRKRGGTKSLRIGGKIREEGIRKFLEETTAQTEGLEYLGYLSEEDRNREYASCSCFLFPSRAEGFGIPIIEVMNYNKPVIAGELGTLKEIAGDCITYFTLYEDADKSAENLADLMMQESFSVDRDAYAECVDRYSSENIGKLYSDYLHRTVKS